MNNTEFWSDSEAELSKIMARLLKQQQKRIVKRIENPLGVDLGDQFWKEEQHIFRQELQAHFQKGFLEASRFVLFETFGIKKQLNIAFDLLEIINEKAVDWVKNYLFDLIKGITATTRAVVERALMEYITVPGFQLRDFTDMIDPYFGAWRAENIAVTETTRAFAEAGLQTAEEIRSGGWEFEEIWNTRNDELVCEICGPLNGKPLGVDWVDYPPAHPHCRCWVTRRLKI